MTALSQNASNYHIWNENYINARMDYNPEKPMSIILLRVFKLDRPILIENKPEWIGCKIIDTHLT